MIVKWACALRPRNQDELRWNAKDKPAGKDWKDSDSRPPQYMNVCISQARTKPSESRI